MRFLPLAALCLGLASPAAAFDPAAMSDAERTAFGAAVRSYLMDNPEVLVEVIGVLEQKQQSAQAMTEQQFLRDNGAVIYNNANDWVGGNPDGDVTLVEFVDYRCRYCRQAWTEVESLVAGDGNLRIVMKEYPILGEDSLTSAKFAIAARKLGGDEVYKRAHDELIALKGPTDDAALEEIARGLGLDYAEVAVAMTTEETAAIIRENHALGAALQISGTPTFIVREALVRGYLPMAEMKSIVEEQRALN